MLLLCPSNLFHDAKSRCRQRHGAQYRIVSGPATVPGAKYSPSSVGFSSVTTRTVVVAAATTPMSDQTYSSSGPARCVVEAKAGFAERYLGDAQMLFARPRAREAA
mgnify:CR=1 FL=1